MLKKILILLVAAGILLTACGPQGTPTLAPADVENTAVAAAWTMVAMTQLAIPTATPVPPTETPSPTPLPTFTPPASPTLSDVIAATATNKPATGDCLWPLNVAEAGPQSRVRIENDSGGTIEWLSLNLGTNAFGQCGALGYSNIGKGATLVLSLPKGTWWVYAGIKYQDGSSSSPAGVFTLNVAFDDLVSVVVRKDGIVAK